MKDKHNDVVACFDTYVKVSLRNCIYDIRKKSRKLLENEFSVDYDTLNIADTDNYAFEENYVKVLDFDMMIKNDLLYEALVSLEKHQRDIIYLSACRNLSDKKIGNILNMSRSKVQRIKSTVIKHIRCVMTGE